MLKEHSIQPDITTMLLIEMESEGKIHFNNPQLVASTASKPYVFSKKAYWYWIVIVLAAVTTISVFTIPETAFPAIYLRSALGIVFVLFLPGYAFIKMLFPSVLPIKTNSENLDNIERFILSLSMSLALVPIVGLILYYTPLGVQLFPITLSLLALTAISATVAVLREDQIRTTSN
jgi:uncharacterized membrane protein